MAALARPISFQRKMQLDKIFLGLGFTKSTTELVTLLFVMVAISALFWVLIGRFRLHNFLINTYIAFALLTVLPDTILTGSKYLQVVVFFIFLVVLTLMNRFLFDIHQSGSGLALWQVFVMSFLEVGLILSIILALIPVKEALVYLSKDALFYFISAWARIVWMALPLLFLIFANKQNR